MEKHYFPGGVIGQHCPQCGGDVCDVDSVERILVDAAPVYQLWINSRLADENGVDCPNCGRTMRRARMNLDSGKIELDVCRHCRHIWFDPGEMAQAAAHAASAGEGYSVRQQEKPEVIPEKPQGYPDVPESWQTLNRVVNGTKLVCEFLGMPVKDEAPGLSRFPFVTFASAAICIIVCLCTWRTAEDILVGNADFINEYGFVVNEWGRMGGLTVITSMFIHGGIVHLISNMYFLITFGLDVENMLGHWKYMLLLLAGGLCATILFSVTSVDTSVPCVGASGFISTVIACFAITYPRLRLGYRLRIYWRITFPVWLWFAFWIAGQIFAAFITMNQGGGGVAYFAHIGGTIPGIVVAAYWRITRSSGKARILPRE